MQACYYQRGYPNPAAVLDGSFKNRDALSQLQRPRKTFYAIQQEPLRNKRFFSLFRQSFRPLKPSRRDQTPFLPPLLPRPPSSPPSF